MTTPNNSAAVQRTRSAEGRRVSVRATRSLRDRIDSLTNEAFAHIERDGSMINGKPHPLMDSLTALLAAGTAHRAHILALKRAARRDNREEHDHD